MHITQKMLDLREILALTRGKTCCSCGSWDIEYVYVVPIEYGGRNVLTNLIPMCKDCREKSGHRFIWESQQGFDAY